MIEGRLYRIGSLVDYEHRGRWHTGMVRSLEGDQLFIEARKGNTIFRFWKKISEVRGHYPRPCIEKLSHQRDYQVSGSKAQGPAPVEMAG